MLGIFIHRRLTLIGDVQVVTTTLVFSAFVHSTCAVLLQPRDTGQLTPWPSPQPSLADTLDDDAVDALPADHSSALTYLVSFGIILLAIFLIVFFVFVMKLRKRRRASRAVCPRRPSQAEFPKERVGDCYGEKRLSRMSTATTLTPVRNSIRADVRRPTVPPLSTDLQTRHRPECHCRHCLITFDGIAFQRVSATQPGSRIPVAGSPPGYASPSSSRDANISHASTPPVADENFQDVSISVSVRSTPPPSPLSPRRYEWQLVHGPRESPTSLSVNASIAPVAATRIGPDLAPARISQLSPLSSLATSIFRALDKPAAPSESAASLALDVSAPAMADSLERDAAAMIEIHSSALSMLEKDLADTHTWLSDAEWTDNGSPAQLLYSGDEGSDRKAADSNEVEKLILPSSKSPAPADSLDDEALRSLT
ncbi:predicted protein [Postia placenta Mad-698-R]|nr:predicted protein [Postia placenta Mad-698-R]